MVLFGDEAEHQAVAHARRGDGGGKGEPLLGIDPGGKGRRQRERSGDLAQAYPIARGVAPPISWGRVFSSTAGSTLPVPCRSTWNDTGWATPMA